MLSSVDFDAVLSTLWRGFVTLGGIAFLKQIVDYFRSKPKLIGEVEQTMIAKGTTYDGRQGMTILLFLYVVNARITPTTVRGWTLEVEKGGKKWVGESWLIRGDLHVPGAEYVDWKSAVRLIDHTDANLLEFRKGVRGWLMFFVEGADNLQDDAQLNIHAHDALGKKHTIKHKTGGKRISQLAYYPGVGIKT